MVKSKLTFGAAMEELEKLTAKLESSEVDLEEGLKQYQRGLELVAYLKGRLADTENKVQEINRKFKDVLEEETV